MSQHFAGHWMENLETNRLAELGRHRPERLNWSPPRILLVDDELTFGKIMCKVAQIEGIPVTFCSSIREVNKVLQEKTFDVAIFDFDLGVITGVQLGGFMERSLKNIPVLLVSQYKHVSPNQWPACVKKFLNKSVGPYEIFRSALAAYEEAEINKIRT